MKTWLRNFSHVIPFYTVGFLLLILVACKDNNRVHPDPVEFMWDFNSGSDGWAGDFADYPVGEETAYNLLFEHDTLPEPLDQTQGALKLSGNNHSNNLFMFVKKKVTGLDANTIYYVTFTVEFASNEPVSNTGNQNSPGNLIHLAAGASPLEPVKIIDENNFYNLNIDKCNQGQNGEDMIVIGDFTNDTDQAVYALKTVENANPFHCTTNESGELWIIIGTHSESASFTTIYYNNIKVELY